MVRLSRPTTYKQTVPVRRDHDAASSGDAVEILEGSKSRVVQQRCRVDRRPIVEKP